jgi:hypothetical protein
MISGKQFKNMIDYMLQGGLSSSRVGGFIDPTATFTAAPTSYTDSLLPVSIVLSGTITPNSGVVTSWAITAGTSPTPIAVGTNNVPTVTLSGGSIPAAIGTYNYYLTVYYTDSNLATQSFLVSSMVIISATALYGQLANPGENIIIAADLTPGIEATLTVTDKATMINVFNIIALNTARIVIVVPDSYGTVTAIEDGSALDVTSQFNVIVDAPNTRTIYVSLNTVTPATYSYKLIF